jgi:hypothetical protein
VFQVLFFDIQSDYTRGDKSDAVIARDQGQVFAPSKEDSGDTIRLVGGLDEQFGDLADEVAVAIVCFSAEEIGCVQHFSSLPKPLDAGISTSKACLKNLWRGEGFLPCNFTNHSCKMPVWRDL